MADATFPSIQIKRPVQAVLFVCAMNAVRSPMAEALARYYFGRSLYVQSAGIRQGIPDAFMMAALGELGIDATKHKPRTLKELEEWEGLNFDLVVTLSPEAHHAALEYTNILAFDVEYWPTLDATRYQGSRERLLDAYRDVRDSLAKRIQERFKGNV